MHSASSAGSARDKRQVRVMFEPVRLRLRLGPLPEWPVPAVAKKAPARRARRREELQCLIGQCEDRQRATQFGIVPKLLVATDRTQAVLILVQTRGHADACPAADAGVHADILLALVFVGEDVADDARRRLELEQFLVDVVGIDTLEVSLERAVAGDTAGRHQYAAPHRKLLRLRL